jgi:hypothetical protein
MSKPKQGVAREDNFTLYLKKASEEVQSWPSWKQTALGTGNSFDAFKQKSGSPKKIERKPGS